MSTVPPPATQPQQPAPSTAQAVPQAVVRDPSAELLRLAAGTRVEGTVQPPPPPQVDAGRAAAQAVQAAVDARQATQQAQSAQPSQPQPSTPTQQTPPPQTQAPQPQHPQQQGAPPARGNEVTVRTPAGDVTLRTPLPLPQGAQVAFDIVNTNANQVTVRFASLNGQPIQPALVQLAADRAAAPLPQAPAQPAPSGVLAQPPTLAFGQVWTPTGAVGLQQAGPLNAFVLAGNTPLSQNVLGQPLTGLISGSDLTVRITGVTQGQPGTAIPSGPQPGVIAPIAAQAVTPGTPQAAGQTALGAQAGATPAGAAPATPTGTPSATAPGAPAGPQTGQPVAATPGQSAVPSPAANPPSGPGALLPAGAQAQQGLRIVSGQGWPPPPFTTPSNVQQTPVQLALTGTVTAQSTAAQTVIQTPEGSIQLGSRANLPPGTVVTIDVLNQTPPRADGPPGTAPVTAPPPAVAALPFTAGAVPWPVLSEALQLLQRADPQAAQLLANSLPDGGPRTVVAALSFVQAMRTGDPRAWPGDSSLRALERAGPRGSHLARTLAGEVAQLGAQSRESAGDWRTTPIPWNANGQVEKIALITRREDPPEDDDKAESKGKGGLRFLLDLDLSNLGEIQLDGMVHEDTKDFDMVVRTHETLDDEIRRDLTGLFVAANQAVGLKGGITFQVTKKFADPIGAGNPMKLERDGVWA